MEDFLQVRGRFFAGTKSQAFIADSPVAAGQGRVGMVDGAFFILGSCEERAGIEAQIIDDLRLDPVSDNGEKPTPSQAVRTSAMTRSRSPLRYGAMSITVTVCLTMYGC
ncbi:MAG: hypothetical protein QMB76_01800 [Alphaproteobacteria bacterium]